jgi:hypothetical protein
MSEPAEEPDGWVVTSPDGHVVAAGPQIIVQAETGEEQ